MTPAARVAAAIEVLDAVLSGAAPEQALTSWGRTHRFAGSKDRAAIRDHVFQALRCRASYAWIGGAETGRGIMLGAMRAAGLAEEMFNGVGHAPPPISDAETGQLIEDAPRAVQLDVPEWQLPRFDAALGGEADNVLALMRHRAGVFVRVNTAKGDVASAQAVLAADGIVTQPVDQVTSALQIVENERKLSQSRAYLDGLVELQDPSSQIAIEALGDLTGLRVLDICAGGGGKSLAMAARGAQVSAYDIDPRRMKDIPARAKRAGVTIKTVQDIAKLKGLMFDLVFCDAPCSGSGTWRRTPSAKWALTPERLSELTAMQASVLRDAAGLVAPGGRLAYATCSVFERENNEQIQMFIFGNSTFDLSFAALLPPRETGDGFFYAVMKRTT